MVPNRRSCAQETVSSGPSADASRERSRFGSVVLNRDQAGENPVRYFGDLPREGNLMFLGAVIVDLDPILRRSRHRPEVGHARPKPRRMAGFAPVSDNAKPELWATEHSSVLYDSPDAATEAALDGWELPLPRFLTVHGWAPARLGMRHGDILDRIMEDIASEHQTQDGDLIAPSQRMIDAEKRLVDAFLADYHPMPWQIVPGHDIEVNVADWIREKAPGWIEENPNLLAIPAAESLDIS